MLNDFGVQAELMKKIGNNVNTLLPFNTMKEVLANDAGMNLYDIIPTVSSSDNVADTSNNANSFYVREGATVTVSDAVGALLTATS